MTLPKKRDIVPRCLVMPKKRIQRVEDDVREHPCYSVSEAAYYLGIPTSTLHTWITGVRYVSRGMQRKSKPLIEPADPKTGLLSFYNIVEAHILVSTRRRRIPMNRVRIAVEYVREKIGGRHPLATYKFATIGKSVFIHQLEGQTVDASRYGQPALGDVLDKYLRGIKRSKVDNLPIEIQPMRPKTLQPSPVVIDPYISSGKPVIKSTGIVASVVWQRASAGESIPDLAIDYGLDESEIAKVVRYFDATA